MSYLSPIDATQVYFEPLDDDDDRLRPGQDRHDDCDPSRRSDRLEDARERFERFEGFERFEEFAHARLDDPPGAHPSPRL